MLNRLYRDTPCAHVAKAGLTQTLEYVRGDKYNELFAALEEDSSSLASLSKEDHIALSKHVCDRTLQRVAPAAGRYTRHKSELREHLSKFFGACIAANCLEEDEQKRCENLYHALTTDVSSLNDPREFLEMLDDLSEPQTRLLSWLGGVPNYGAIIQSIRAEITAASMPKNKRLGIGVARQALDLLNADESASHPALLPLVVSFANALTQAATYVNTLEPDNPDVKLFRDLLEDICKYVRQTSNKLMASLAVQFQACASVEPSSAVVTEQLHCTFKEAPALPSTWSRAKSFLSSTARWSGPASFAIASATTALS